MAQSLPTAFQAWEFTDDEIPVARTFTDLQTKHLQTEMAIYAQTLVQMELDTTNLQASALIQAKLQGRIEAIQALLATSEDAKPAYLLHLQRQQESQQD